MQRSPSPRRSRRRRMMACTTSIGPGATNMVTAAAVAHVNRLPVLLLPGDVFAEPPARSGVAAGRGFRRRHGLGQRLLPSGVALFRPHHAAGADHRGAAARHERADGPGRHAGPLRSRCARTRRPRPSTIRKASSPSACGRSGASRPDERELAEAARLIAAREKPLIIAGGGVHYSEADRGACGVRASGTAFRSPRRRPAKAHCRTIIRSTWGRSV